MSESLKGKVAVVTGAASGIGLATTKLLIEADVKVFMVDWDEKTVREKSKDLGENAIPQITNLLDVESCAASVADVVLPLIPLLVPLAFLAATYWTNLGKFNLPFP